MPRLTPGNPTRLLAALVATSALLLAACGGGDDGGGDGGGDAAETTTSTTAPVFAPLTGVQLADASVAQRPAVVIKVDNSPDGRPQTGIDKADVIIEEKVEGSVTRLLTAFHSEDAPEVGPVRSVRSTDVNIVSAIGGVFAYSGGIGPFVELIKKAPVVSLSEDGKSGAFQQKKGKRRPYATYTSTAALREAAGDGAKAPPKLFETLPPGGAFSAPGEAPAARAKVVFGPRTFGEWEYDAATGLWLRSTNGTPHTVEGGGRLGFTNVVVQLTEYKGTPYTDTSGSAVDEAVVVGSGEALILSQGKQVRATWTKSAPNAVTTYAVNGVPVKLPPGRTWVSLPPPGLELTVA